MPFWPTQAKDPFGNYLNHIFIFQLLFSFLLQLHWILRMKKSGSTIFLEPTLWISYKSRWHRILISSKNDSKIEGTDKIQKWYIYMGRIKQYVYIDPMTWDSNGKADDKKEGKESTSLETKDNEEHYKTVYIYHGICKTMAFLSIIWV